MATPNEVLGNAGYDLGELAPLVERAGKIHDEIKDLKAKLDEKGESDNGRITELQAQLDPIKDEMAKIHNDRVAAKAQADTDEILRKAKDMQAEWEASKSRNPSKAHFLGRITGDPSDSSDSDSLAKFHVLVAKANSKNIREATEAQEQLARLGSGYQNNDGKATVGDTDGNGGYLVPNAVVSPLIEQATARNIWRQELSVIRGIRGNQVEVPTEGLSPTGATIIAAGQTKTNLAFTVNSYTATLYTLAAIYDVSNQLLRQSEGAAEQLVRSRLARALALGEAKYILAGSGSSEPKGLLTSLGTSGTWVTSFSPSATTLAGSVAAAIAAASGVVAARDRTPTAAVLNPARFWDMLSQGTDSAGFFFDPAGGPTGIDATVPTVRVFGVRVFPDSNMNAANGAADDLIVGDFRSAQLFVGNDYRVDVSTEANDRWDKNLTGFRAEEEIGFNADPYVVSGYFQRILDIQP